MRDEFFIERHGKKYVLFAGLLDEAHNKNLTSIQTKLLQSPSEENGQVAIVHARVELEHGKYGYFEGIGDASPDNVGRAIVPHLIRMAETRAKARALRDAVNIGVTALEELGGEDTPNQPRPGVQTANTGAQNEEEPERTPGGATVRAANYLKHLGQQEYGSVESFEKQMLGGKPIEQLSAGKVKTLIEGLKS